MRFHNENLTGGASGSRAVMAQEPAECWCIIDSTMASGLKAGQGTMLGPALFSGRVAGAWAAYEAGYGKGFTGKADRQ